MVNFHHAGSGNFVLKQNTDEVADIVWMAAQTFTKIHL